MMQGDEFFSEAELSRLAELMGRWRTARDAGDTLSSKEQAELDALIEAELFAAMARSAKAVGPNPEQEQRPR